MIERSADVRRVGWIRLGIAAAGIAAGALGLLLWGSPLRATQSGEPGSIELGKLEYNGTACAKPADQLEKAADSPARFHLEFSEFTLTVNGDGQQIATCSFALPIRIAPRTSIRMVGGEWSGHAKVASAGKASVQRSWFFAGQSGIKPRAQAFDAGLDGAFFFRDDLRDELPDPNAGWTPCRAEPTQRIARASTELIGEGAGTVLTIHFGNLFDLETRSCDPEAK